jgi:hypothetical protein
MALPQRAISDKLAGYLTVTDKVFGSPASLPSFSQLSRRKLTFQSKRQGNISSFNTRLCKIFIRFSSFPGKLSQLRIPLSYKKAPITAANFGIIFKVDLSERSWRFTLWTKT